MNFRFNSLVFLWMLIAAVTAQIPEDSKLSSLLRLRPAELKAEVWKLPKAEREEIIRQYKASVTPAVSADAVRVRLVSLGDRTAAQETVKEMVEDGTHFHRNLGHSGNPYVVQALSPYLFKEEPYSVTPGDVGMVPVSFASTFIAIQVLSDSSAFNGEVISWARRHQHSDPVALRAELRRWWKENEPFFEKEDFLSVKPGLDIPKETPVINSERASPSAPSAAASPPKIANQQSSSNDSNVIFYIASGLLLLLITAFVLMARAQHGRGA